MSSVKKAFPFWTLRRACLEVNWPQACTLSYRKTSVLALYICSSRPSQTFHCFSQALRVSSACHNKTDFERHLDDMKSWLQARNYHKYLAEKEMSKSRFNKEKSNTKQSKSKGVTFLVTYHPLLKSFRVWLITIWIFYILMKTLKKFLCLDPW